MSDILTREEFEIAINERVGGFWPDTARCEILDHDAALRACIQQAVLDVEKAPHAESCTSRKQYCLTCGQDYDDHYGQNCASSHDLDIWKPSLEAKACNCGHDAAIVNLKKGLGEKS